ncbi:hypothetical protein V8P78_27085 [Rhizobium sp. 6AS6]|uniref:Uncharacterized protein n=1 Tax=Rhizobium aouanii TaxID=3118145 RepID=A0ABU8CS24_9HYPH
MTRSEKPAPVDNLEKQAIIAACEAFIRDILKPRFLPEIRPTEWNYVVDIRGSWAGNRYRFMQRYRSGFEDITARSSMPPSPASTAWDQTGSISIGCGTQANGGGSIPG